MRLRRAVATLVLALAAAVPTLPAAASASGVCTDHIPSCAKEAACAIADRVLGGRTCGI